MNILLDEIINLEKYIVPFNGVSIISIKKGIITLFIDQYQNRSEIIRIVKANLSYFIGKDILLVKCITHNSHNIIL